MSKETLKKELKNSSKENLKKELKGTELSVKDKELQVVYEELEYVCKVADEWRNLNNSEALDPKKVEEIDKRFDAAIQYLDDNFSKDFLKNSKVRPGSMFEENIGGDVVDFLLLDNEVRHMKGALIEPLTDNQLLRDFDMKKQEAERDFEVLNRDNDIRVELSPYTQRLQKMIKERTGR